MTDMVQGAYVGVGDTDAKIIGSARLGAGVITPESNCRLSFTVTVPDRDTYLFVIGDRAAFSLPATVLDNNDWVITRDWDFQ